jgi:hypothetical protein
MNRACISQNTNLHEQKRHVSSIRPIKNNFVRMKTYNQLLMVLFLFVSKIAYGDIAPSSNSNASTQHYVTVCTKITNLNEYPEISLLGYVKSYVGSSFHTYEVSLNQCLTKDYKYNTLCLYAVKKTYLEGKDISTMDLPNDKNAVKASIPLDPADGYYVAGSNPLISEEYFYKIIGFTETSFVLYKWKVVNKFNNGQADLVVNIPNINLISLSQSIPTSIPTNHSESGVELFPNPTQKSAHLKFTNTYTGKLLIAIYSIDGKKVNSTFIRKDEPTLDYEMSIASLSKGTYLVYIGIGGKVVWKKLIVN